MSAPACPVCGWDGQGDDPLTCEHVNRLGSECPGPELLRLRRLEAAVKQWMAESSYSFERQVGPHLRGGVK